MQAPANADAIQNLPRPAVEPATAVDRKRACQTIRKWPGRITAAEPPYPGTAVGKSDSTAPLLAVGSASKGLGAAGWRQNHSRDTMLPHNAGMEPASGIACNRLRRQGRFQNARKGQIEVHLYYISFKRKPATLEPNTSLRQRENPSRLFREASATGIPLPNHRVLGIPVQGCAPRSSDIRPNSGCAIAGPWQARQCNDALRSAKSCFTDR